jgi:hypothetical protein
VWLRLLSPVASSINGSWQQYVGEGYWCGYVYCRQWRAVSMVAGSSMWVRATGVATFIVASGEQYQWQSLTKFTDPCFEFPVICRNNIHFVESNKIKVLNLKCSFCRPTLLLAQSSATIRYNVTNVHCCLLLWQKTT